MTVKLAIGKQEIFAPFIKQIMGSRKVTETLPRFLEYLRLLFLELNIEGFICSLGKNQETPH